MNIIITENGYADDGSVDDFDRINYYRVCINNYYSSLNTV